MTFIQFAFA